MLAIIAAFAVVPARQVVITMAITACFGCVVLVTQSGLRRSQHPERWLIAEQSVGVVALSAVLALTNGLASPAVGAMALAIALAGARFRGTTLVAVATTNVALMLGACIVADPSAIADDMASIYTWIATLTGIAALTTILANSERTARRDAVLDPLTGLLNRKALARRIEELEPQARLTGSPVAVLAIDLDGFKQVNDRLGHDAGDAVLREVAYAMRKTLRGFDLLYRTGGDEFLVLLPGGNERDARRLAEDLRIAVERLDGDCAGVTLSLGIAAATGAEVRVAEMQAAADRALYAAKGAGRNRVSGAVAAAA